MQAQATIKDLLLAATLSDHQVASLLKPYGFSDLKKADANLQFIGKHPRERILFSEILEEALLAFSESPDPDLSLNNFERFSQTTFSKAELYSTLKASPLTLHYAAKIFGGSRFLSDILIRNPEYFYWVFDPSLLNKSKSKIDFRKTLRRALSFSKIAEAQIDMLRVFKRKETLRIGVRDMIRAASVAETLKDVSNLADVLIECAHSVCERRLRKKHGKPAVTGQSSLKDRVLAGFTVLALGKLGSRELNFSSDVDLIYLYEARLGETSGGRGTSIQNALYFESLAKDITAALNTSTGEGYLYRVDLRLRPEGEMGLIALPLEAYRRYYKKRGETWERMVLLRARPVSGHRALGKAFLKMIGPFVYEQPCGQRERLEIRHFKERIDKTVAIRKHLFRDVKRGVGGIREIEFIVQILQLQEGTQDEALRGRGIIRLLNLLAAGKLLSSEIAKRLTEAYLFLRDVENKLQMLDDHQTHLLPSDPTEKRHLAIMLGYSETEADTPSAQFKRDYRFHTTQVHQAYEDLFYA